VPLVVPPTGYVLDPSDAARPVYMVNPGPHVVGFGVGFGIVPYARPTFSEGGYAYADAYPHDYPYIHSYGFGNELSLPGVSCGPDGDLFARPYGAPPYTAYRYRAAPSAKIIHLPPQD